MKSHVPPTTLWRRHLAQRDRASNCDLSSIEVDVPPLQSEDLATADTRREEEQKGREEARLVFPGNLKRLLNFVPRPCFDFWNLGGESTAYAAHEVSDTRGRVAV
jgi:hypothetical protein